MISQFGFSIKSLIGRDSTLFNAGTGTNFIYEVVFPEGVVIDVTQFNKDTMVDKKIPTRIAKIESLGGQLKFHSVQSKRLQLNLTLIDTGLPQILSYMVYYRYRDSLLKVNKLVELLNNRNPMNFDMHCGHPFYEHKIKNLLTDTALGMTPEKVWNGQYDATGGLIFVKDDGDVLCYHIYNRNEFQEYLFNHTRLEQASTSEDEDNPGNARTEKKAKPYKFGWLYEEDGKLFFKLNLQIRFSD
jgi:hypothetical protein